MSELTKALVKAQAELRNPLKDKENPFFKSMYADLPSLLDTIREPLTKNGLAFTQTFEILDRDMILVTTLRHTSGESIDSRIRVDSVKKDPQGIGSAITYYKRYALGAMVGITGTDEHDDDGNQASGKEQHKPKIEPGKPSGKGPIKPIITKQEIIAKIKSAVKEKDLTNTDVSDYIQHEFGQGKSANDLTVEDLMLTLEWVQSIPDPRSLVK